ncbi:MAG: polysaccharide deacetylase family protein [Clostridiales bacterium]|mgnify:CR=1 FL=1|nr:polysaccharide deacetylase family protein [Clostridiales bacterium]
MNIKEKRKIFYIKKVFLFIMVLMWSFVMGTNVEYAKATSLKSPIPHEDTDSCFGTEQNFEKSKGKDKTIQRRKPKPKKTTLKKPGYNRTKTNKAAQKSIPTATAITAQVIRRSANKELKQVAITFDDGPDDYFTPQVLDILKEHGIKATFFVLGAAAKTNQDVLKRIDEEGHTIASHGWSHTSFRKLSKEKAILELQRTNAVIKEVTGRSNNLFRLPYGDYNNKTLKTIAEQGFYNIYWSVDPWDWSGKSPKAILDNVKQNTAPGAIILLHSAGSQDSIPKSLAALPEIIGFLQGEGYEIVTIPQLLGLPGVRPYPGKRFLPKNRLVAKESPICRISCNRILYYNNKAYPLAE